MRFFKRPCVRSYALYTYWLVGMLLGFLIVANAQSESGGAGIEGLVVDQSGAAVAGATVVIKNRETGYTRTVTTDANGRYAAGVLPVGVYEVEATVSDRQPGRRIVKLTVGNTESVDLKLEVAGVSEIIEVTADQGVVDVQESATGLNISERAIRDLPIRGRNFAEFFQLQPGIMQEQDRSGLVVAGQRSINSNVAVDGADFNDPLQGNQRGGNEAVFFFPQSAVREFQVVRAGASAEIGRTNAGFLNVVTKSGTNEFHGEAFYFNRNRFLTSPDAFGRDLDNLQNQFGGSVGGPIKRDRVFFFAAAEQNFLRVPFVVSFNVPTGQTLPQVLRDLEGEKRGTNNPTALFVRGDYILNSRNTLNTQYNYTRLRGENFNFENARQTIAESVNYARQNRSHGFKSSLVTVVTDRFVNELRGQIANDDRDEVPNSQSSQIDIAGVGTVGGDNGRPRTFRTLRFQLSDNVSYTGGRHQLRFGFDLNFNRVQQQRAAAIQGRYGFTGGSALPNYLRALAGVNTINRYRGFLPGTPQEPATFRGVQQEIAVFITDKIRVLPTLTVTVGLRWEGQFNPQPIAPNPDIPETQRIPNDLEQWQPRLGLAWNINGDKKTVVRASAGIFTARTPATLFQRVTTENGILNLAIDTNNIPAGPRRNALLAAIFPFFPNALPALPAGFSPIDFPQRVYGFARDFQNPRSFQASLTIERQFFKHWSVTAGFIRNSTWDLQRRVNRNLPPPGSPGYIVVGNSGYVFFNTAFRPIQILNGRNYGPILINESSAHSSYNGGTLTVTRRYVNRFQLTANYTFSRTMDDDSNERNFNQEFSINPFNLKLERGPSKQDIRHNFNLSGLVDLPYGFIVSALIVARSGLPYTPIIGDDVNNDGNENDRAIINGVVVGRNTFRQPNFFNLDLRVVKGFRVGEQMRLDFLAEFFNVTRNTNKNYDVDAVAIVEGPRPLANGTLSTAALNPAGFLPYSAPSTARFGGPRQVQLGVRFTF
ncbi:MAG: carboxypeptidase regulatory-like domain-containing protein [Chloracidobacterium sp.]|nr:carboxypeptidase regulatory-like domain-containing protein [Chloracidobacterium sp.]MDW8218878.1 carboxypeptidase regulatory-like domain-containing protein [Acidobacteriota bacterium]